MKRTYDFDKKVEEAIGFLVTSVSSSGHNPKPVILHSVRVGMVLYKGDYSEDVVVAGFLHDLLEDTAVTAGEIRKKFGDGVVELVSANSFKNVIKDPYERDKEVIERCLKVGREALIIKAADTLDNLPYYNFEHDKYSAMRRIDLFIQLAGSLLGGDLIFRELAKKFKTSSSSV